MGFGDDSWAWVSMNSPSERAQLYLSTNASLNELNRKNWGAYKPEIPHTRVHTDPTSLAPAHYADSSIAPPPEQNAASPVLRNVIKTLHIQDKLLHESLSIRLMVSTASGKTSFQQRRWRRVIRVLRIE
jgi:hypothetical protein